MDYLGYNLLHIKPDIGELSSFFSTKISDVSLILEKSNNLGFVSII